MRNDTFIRILPIRVFIEISKKDNYVHNIVKDTRTTYTHIYKMVDKFIENGLVAREKKGRLVLLSLTVKGKDISERFKSLLENLSKVD